MRHIECGSARDERSWRGVCCTFVALSIIAFILSGNGPVIFSRRAAGSSKNHSDPVFVAQAVRPPTTTAQQGSSNNTSSNAPTGRPEQVGPHNGTSPRRCSQIRIEHRRMWAIGDSLSAEAQAYPFKKRKAEPSYARLVASAFQLNLTLTFSPGATAEKILEVIQEAVLELKSSNDREKRIRYDFCLIFAGTNDIIFNSEGRGRNDLNSTIRSIQEIHHTCLQVATTTVVLMIPQRQCGMGKGEDARLEEVNKALSAFSEEIIGCPAVNLTRTVPRLEPLYWTDCVHFSSAGRSLLSQAVVNALQSRGIDRS